MGNSVSLPTLPLTEFEDINSFFGTRQAVKWLQMIFPACICCVETSKNNHPLLAGEIILAKPLIHTKLCQWKSAAAFINLADAISGRWRSVGGRGFPSAGVHVRRRSGRGWCCQGWYMHHHDSTECSICLLLDVALCPSHSALPSAPAGHDVHTWCAQNNRHGWLFHSGTRDCSTQVHLHLVVTPQAALVNITSICCYYFCHFLALLFAALVLLLSTPVTSPINNAPLIAFCSNPFFPHLSQLCNPDLRWSWWPCVAVRPSWSSALPFPCLRHSAKHPFAHQGNHWNLYKGCRSDSPSRLYWASSMEMSANEEVQNLAWEALLFVLIPC